MEEEIELLEVKLKTWYVREWDKAYFYCEIIEDKYVEGHGFINDEFCSFLHFERGQFDIEWKLINGEDIEDYFENKSKADTIQVVPNPESNYQWNNHLNKYTKMDLMLRERGFTKETDKTYTLEISKSRKIIIDVGVITPYGPINAMYLKQLEDCVSLMGFKLDSKKDAFHLKLMIDILKED